ncbi:carboxypeptidase family protein [Taibaiella chishuiensis]|uniref:Carboxypeptidase family protein n=2 Tax=Taibaiella chishuiensis TaxID=1434707 RepID=A0A2P8D9K5_9BACT|nr:carboxypeptidase family protein [Taibaiella chishuiensis]
MYLNSMEQRMLRLQLPEACNEDWNEMKPRGCGRFCAQCNKTVIDFTEADDAAIARFFANKPLQVCGRFRDDQLNRPIPFPDTKERAGLRLQLAKIAASLALLQATATNLQAQENQQQIVLSGNVTDYLSQQPLAGVEITIAGINYPKYSDRDGNFSFVLPADYAGKTLTVQATYPLNAAQEIPGFKIREEQVLIGSHTATVQLKRYPYTALEKIDISVPDTRPRTGEVYIEPEPRTTSAAAAPRASLSQRIKSIFKKKKQ